ncbi:hypothetical protein AALP_AA4G188800 [Arabis alpina]|uniref:CCHC-type domain-containing protein n=1 Tax=Arabis alpina TaxID=50452 RepID=A0A087H458_ARAAL|nr:hypothetical protein AALP_AA4G188800 [Arabis alpina]
MCDPEMSMENPQHVYAILEPENFGWWKVQVQALIQGIDEDAWTMVEEGTDSVRRTRVDMLASKFETMTMEKHESVEAFSGRLNAIANEASVLGKKYKDKKLVKKFLRSLPDKFQSHKSAIDVSMNSDDMTFPQVIGMMQAFELEYNTKVHIKAKDVAFKSNAEERKSDEHENQIKLIVKKHFKRLDQGQHRGVVSQQRSGSSHTIIDADKSLKQGDGQCSECQGYEHRVRNCPTTKRREQIKCSVCKGLGHTRADCVGIPKGKEKSLLTWSDCDSEDEERYVAHSCAGYFGVIEDDETNLTLLEDSKLLSEHLHAEYEKFGKEARSDDLQGVVDRLNLLLKERSEECQKLHVKDMIMENEIDHLKELLNGEKVESESLRGKVHWGLGYQGGPSTNKHVFVKASQPKMVMQKQQPQDGMVRRQLDVNQQKPQDCKVLDVNQDIQTKDESKDKKDHHDAGVCVSTLPWEAVAHNFHG